MSEELAAPNLIAKNAIARIYKGNTVIGAGFVVAGEYVITCAHVVRDALALKAGDSPIGATIKINLPYASLVSKLQAEVCLYRYLKDEDVPDEDIAGLRLLEPLPANVHPVKLQASYQMHSPYCVIGFPKGHPKGIASYGQLLQDLPNGLVQMEDTKTQGTAILPGFSGTPVWNEVFSAVVGMVVAREKDQPEAKIGFMVPARTLMAVHRELNNLSLLSILRDHAEKLADAIKTAYRLCCPVGWEIPSELTDKLLTLQDVKQGDSAFEAIARFVALLSLPELNPNSDLREKLEAWVKPRVKELQKLLEEAKSLLTQHHTKQSANVTSHLLIYVKDESGKARSVSALFVRDGQQYDVRFGTGSEPLNAPGKEPFAEKVTLETLPSLVQACLDEALDKSPTHLTLHLILPIAWLNQACDRWSLMNQAQFTFLPDVRIGVRFCCVVRITERLHPEILKMFKKPWQQKWDKLLSLPVQDICTAFVAGDALSPETELQARLNQPNSVGLKLSTIYEEGRYFKLFGTLIATGTPAAVWLRTDQFSEEVCAATDLNGLLNCRIDELPEMIKQFRSNALAVAENAHIGHHLSFLWDDPNLIPPSTQTTLRMPQP